MDVKLDLAENCELEWAILYDAVRKASKNKPLYVSLEAKPVKDGLEKELVLGNDNLPVEAPKHQSDEFWLSVDSDYCPNYLGSAKRICAQDSAKFSYSDDAMSQLRHEIGLRLGLLEKLGRAVYFTSKLFGYDIKEVDADFAACLLNSGRKTLGIVKEKII